MLFNVIDIDIMSSLHSYFMYFINWIKIRLDKYVMPIK